MLSILLASATVLYILIFTFKDVSPYCLRSYFINKELKGNIFFVGGDRNMPWSSGWVNCYLFIFKNNFAFAPALQDDERHFELLKEKRLLSFLATSLVFHQCLIPIFHSFLSLLPFSTVIAICFGNKKRMKGKTKQPGTVADNDKSVGKLFGNLRGDSGGFSAHRFQLHREQWLSSYIQRTRWDMGLVFSFSSKLHTWANNLSLTHMENLQTQTHSFSPISAGMKSKLQIS